MAEISDPNSAMATNSSVAVVGSQYTTPYPMELSVVKKVMTLKDGAFQVLDPNDNVLFKVKGSMFSIFNTRVLVDGAGTPLVTFQQKLLTAHRRWQAFKGQSTDPKDMLFSVKKSAILQFKTKLYVYLAANTKEEVSDYKIEGSWLDKSCSIYDANSTVIAQMRKKLTAEGIILGKDNFGVTVSPNVDHAFVVALIVILDEINQEQ